MDVTNSVALYVQDKGINLSNLSRKTNIPYGNIRDSISPGGRRRKLRADEFLKICIELGVNPMAFADQQEDKKEEKTAVAAV